MGKVTRLYPDESDRWEVRECKAPVGAVWTWPLGRGTPDGQEIPEGAVTESEGSYVRLSLMATRPGEIFLAVFYESDEPGTMRPTAPLTHEKAEELWHDLGNAIQQNQFYALGPGENVWVGDFNGQVDAMANQMERTGWEVIDGPTDEDACITMAMEASGGGQNVARLCPKQNGLCNVKTYYLSAAAINALYHKAW